MPTVVGDEDIRGGLGRYAGANLVVGVSGHQVVQERKKRGCGKESDTKQGDSARARRSNMASSRLGRITQRQLTGRRCIGSSLPVNLEGTRLQSHRQRRGTAW